MRDIIEIDSILKDFYDVSGIRISIHDTEFNEIYSYPKEATYFCKCLQEIGSVKKDCEKNDHDAFLKVKNSGEVYVYKCRRGLYEAVAPLYSFGTLSGYLMMGQICDTEPMSIKNTAKIAEEILKDGKKAEEITATVKKIDRNLINSYINIMTLLAEYITGTNRTFSDTEKLPALIKEFISKNYSSKITLNTLSHKFGCCNATLTKSFKNEFGITIMDYLFKVRIEKSAELVQKTRRSFKEISNECGFYDQNYFSKSFSKYYGYSPSQYRSLNQKNASE